MERWYYPSKRYQSSELKFSIVFLFNYHRDAKTSVERVYRRGMEYPIVGIRHTFGVDGCYDVMMNDGHVIEHIPSDDVEIIAEEQGTGWGTDHDDAHAANYFNARWRREALEEGKAVYVFGTAEKKSEHARPVFIPLAYVDTRPQRNEPWYLPADKIADKRDEERRRIQMLTALGDTAVKHNRMFAS